MGLTQALKTNCFNSLRQSQERCLNIGWQGCYFVIDEFIQSLNAPSHPTCRRSTPLAQI